MHVDLWYYPLDFPTKLSEDPSALSNTIMVLGKH